MAATAPVAPVSPRGQARLVFNRELADLIEQQRPPHVLEWFEQLRDEILALFPVQVGP